MRRTYLLLALAACATEPGDDDFATDDEAYAATTYANPVLDDSGDPFAMRHAGFFYLYLPQVIHIDGERRGGAVVAYRSKDLVSWDPLGKIFDNVDETSPDGDRTTGLYAPEVLARDGKFYLYYVNNLTGGAIPRIGNRDIAVVESDTPDDFRAGTRHRLLLDGDLPFIDPSPFVDPTTDRQWMVYKKRLRAGGSAIEVRPMDSPRSWGGPASRLLESADVPGAGVTIEQPQLWHAGHLYYLIYSAGEGAGLTYSVRYATARDIRGPYTQRGTLFRSNPDLTGNLAHKVISPGSSSIVRDGDGELWMVYRQKSTKETTFNDRFVAIDAIDFHAPDFAITGKATKRDRRRAPTALP